MANFAIEIKNKRGGASCDLIQILYTSVTVSKVRHKTVTKNVFLWLFIVKNKGESAYTVTKEK